MTILHINASVRGDASVSRALGEKLVAGLKGTDETVINRDLTEGDLHFVSSESLAAVSTAEADRIADQRDLAALADRLIAELQQAETIIIGAPVYNFGPPASLKAWADLVARAGTTFHYTDHGPEGLLKDKKAWIIGVSGGTKIGSDMDFMSNWLTFFLGFIGITDIELITADGIFGQDGEAKVEAAHAHISRIIAGTV